MKRKRKWYKKKRWLFLNVFFVIYIGMVIYHQEKSLPAGISYMGDKHRMTEENIEFLYDLTYQKNDKEIHEQEIFKEVFQMIEEAKEFLIIDMFMVNEFSDESRDFPKLSSIFSEKIKIQLQKHPDMKVVFITDDINRSYNSHEAMQIDYLADYGAEVIYTNLSKLRDSNFLYSGVWRMFFQWFGQEGKGWLPNPFGETSPKVTVRSYLQLMNIKANHRKAIITENNGLVLSANAHDASGFHSNVAFKVAGPILKDMIATERAVAAFSGGNLEAFPPEKEIDEKLPATSSKEDAQIVAQILTEQKVKDDFILAVEQAEEGDEIWIGMFYLADRDIIEALENAADRKVKTRIILDPNENAFGSEKVGLPNIPVARELVERSDHTIEIRWYNTNEEQYHSKIAYLKGKEKSYVTAGSTNFTSRNLDNYNLENNISITAPSGSALMEEIEAYFKRLWYNEDAKFTVAYDSEEDALSPVKYAIYWLQKLLGFTTY